MVYINSRTLVGLGLQYSKIFHLKFKNLTFKNNKIWEDQRLKSKV